MTCTPETGLCSCISGCSTAPGTWPPVLQGCAWLLCSWGWCQTGRILEKGLFWQELECSLSWVIPGAWPGKRLGPAQLGDLGAPFHPNTTLSLPSPTHACSDHLSLLVLTQLHVLQSLYAAGKHDRVDMVCRPWGGQSTPNLADPSLGPSSPHISIQHGARVEWGEGVAVRGLLWRVQLERLRGTAWRKRGDTGQPGASHKDRHPAARRRKRKDAGPVKPLSVQPHPSPLPHPVPAQPLTPQRAPGLPHAGWDPQGQG